MLRSDRRIVRATPASPVTAADVIGREVSQISLSCGTYGMGGPGFAGFKLAEDLWLILCLWGSTGWLEIDGRPIAASADRDGRNARFDPIIPDDVQFGRDRTRSSDDCLAAALPLPATIQEFAFSGHSGHLVLGDHRIRISPDPADRPVLAGSGEARVLTPEDDLAGAWIFAPYPWVEV